MASASSSQPPPRVVVSQRHCFERDLSSPCALVLLNTPVSGAAGARALRRAWRAAHWLRACADGAADRLRLAPGCAHLAPDLIAGDWDSISAEGEAHFARRGVALVKAPEDQDSTDLDKCLRQVALRAADPADARVAAAGGARAVRVIVFGAFGGRLDQEAQNLNALFAWRASFAQITLLSAECVAALLPAGRSLLRVAAPFEGPTCGLLPLGAPVERLSTRGLHWDVTDWATSFGGRVSTSNRVERYPARGAREDAEVEVDSSGDIVWTASCRPADEDGDEEAPEEEQRGVTWGAAGGAADGAAGGAAGSGGGGAAGGSGGSGGGGSEPSASAS